MKSQRNKAFQPKKYPGMAMATEVGIGSTTTAMMRHGVRFRVRLLVSLILFIAFNAQAQTSRILSFSQWKTQQLTDAQNKVTRLSNQLTLMKADASQKKSTKQLEGELRAASQVVEIIKDYTVDHYVATYLNDYADSREALLELSQVTSKEEMADLLAAILKARPAPITAISKPGTQAF